MNPTIAFWPSVSTGFASTSLHSTIFVEGLPIKDIAERFDVSEQKVQALLRNFTRTKDRKEAMEILEDADQCG